MIVNGSPKTGTHLLQKVCFLYGCFGVTHKHDPQIKNTKQIHIIRNPRNVLLSWVRFRGLKVTSSNLRQEMQHVINEMKEYTRLLDDKEALTVRFEDLLTKPNEHEKIMDYLEVMPVDGVFKDMWGATSTFTGRLSNWRKVWTDKLDKKWLSLGGEELEKALGYSKDDPIKVRKAQS